MIENRTNYIWSQTSIAEDCQKPSTHSEKSYRWILNDNSIDKIQQGQVYKTPFDSALYNLIFYIVTNTLKNISNYGILPYLKGQPLNAGAKVIYIENSEDPTKFSSKIYTVIKTIPDNMGDDYPEITNTNYFICTEDNINNNIKSLNNDTFHINKDINLTTNNIVNTDAENSLNLITQYKKDETTITGASLSLHGGSTSSINTDPGSFEISTNKNNKLVGTNDGILKWNDYFLEYIPIGTILMWAGDNIDYLENNSMTKGKFKLCNGDALLIDNYQELANLFLNSDTSSTKKHYYDIDGVETGYFNLPNLTSNDKNNNKSILPFYNSVSKTEQSSETVGNTVDLKITKGSETLISLLYIRYIIKVK